MNRDEQIINEAKKHYYDDINCHNAFLHGVEWADEHPINPWHKFTEEFPPKDGTEVLIAMRNKNMMEDGIWLYDVCFFVGGDYTDNNNWEGKVNWETPLYWKYIKEPTAF